MGDALDLTANEFIAATVVSDASATGDWSALTHLVETGDLATARTVLHVVAELDIEDLIDLTIGALASGPATPSAADRRSRPR